MLVCHVLGWGPRRTTKFCYKAARAAAVHVEHVKGVGKTGWPGGVGVGRDDLLAARMSLSVMLSGTKCPDGVGRR